MSDCPDCENKVVEAEVKAAEEKAEEVKAEEVKAEAAVEAKEVKAVSPAVKVFKSLFRIVAATIIVAGILFLIYKQIIFRWYYENYESAAVKQKIATMVSGGLGENSGFTYTITYFDEGINAEGKKADLNAANGYKITVNDKDGKEVDSFEMYAQYDIAKKELKVLFYENGQEGIWKGIIRKANIVKKDKAAADKVEKAVPAEIKAAPAAN
jgi:hypothetical protein